jgi:hypothetical protein
LRLGRLIHNEDEEYWASEKVNKLNQARKHPAGKSIIREYPLKISGEAHKSTVIDYIYISLHII